MAERVDLDELERVAEQARQGVTGEWTWDDGTLIELDHEDPVGIQVTLAKGSPVAPHIAAADPATVLDLIAELRAARAVVSSAGVASITVERLVNTLSKDRATWDDDAVAMWDAVQVLQRDLSLYRKATT